MKPKTNTNIPGRQIGGAWAPTGRLWPDGQFSIGYAPSGGAELLETPAEYARKWDEPIGLSLASNSHNMRDDGKPRRGTKGMTAHGRKLLKNAVWRMQRLYGKRSLSFLTLTLPGLTYEESWNVSSQWSNIVRVFFQRLGRLLESKGLPTAYASCTELQPGRCEREGHPALHLHIVIVGRWRGRGAWACKPCEFRDCWAAVVQPYLFNQYCWDACENVQGIKKDVSAYLAKYLSKGISMNEPPRSDGTGWGLPTCWYNVSLKLRRWVLDNIRRSPELMELIETTVKSAGLDSVVHYFFAGEIEEMPGPGPHYYVGKFRGDFHRELIEIWKAGVLGGVL